MPWIRDRFRNRIDYREKECLCAKVLVRINTPRKALLLNMGLFDSDYGTFEISVCARDPLAAAAAAAVAAFISNGTDFEYKYATEKDRASRKTCLNKNNTLRSARAQHIRLSIIDYYLLIGLV